MSLLAIHALLVSVIFLQIANVVCLFSGSILTAEGSALVKIGNTSVVCGIKPVIGCLNIISNEEIIDLFLFLRKSTLLNFVIIITQLFITPYKKDRRIASLWHEMVRHIGSMSMI